MFGSVITLCSLKSKTSRAAVVLALRTFRVADGFDICPAPLLLRESKAHVASGLSLSPVLSFFLLRVSNKVLQTCREKKMCGGVSQTAEAMNSLLSDACMKHL